MRCEWINGCHSIGVKLECSSLSSDLLISQLSPIVDHWLLGHRRARNWEDRGEHAINLCTTNQHPLLKTWFQSSVTSRSFNERPFPLPQTSRVHYIRQWLEFIWRKIIFTRNRIKSKIQCLLILLRDAVLKRMFKLYYYWASSILLRFFSSHCTMIRLLLWNEMAGNSRRKEIRHYYANTLQVITFYRRQWRTIETVTTNRASGWSYSIIKTVFNRSWPSPTLLHFL